jgi:hypothetical protein
MSDIFLSYASEDRSRAAVIAKALEVRGWTVWWDRSIPAGKKFPQVIQEEISRARCVVVLWSETSVRSEWVNEEAEEGRKREVLVPILVDPVQPPWGFKLVQAANLADWSGDSSDPAFQALCRDISALLGQSADAVRSKSLPLSREAADDAMAPRETPAPIPSPQIDDVNRVLQLLLRRELEELVPMVDITFATPDAEFPPASVTIPAIDLYLFDVVQNPRNAIYSYMITAWPTASAPDPAADEHQLLRRVAAVLNRHPIISAKAIQEMWETKGKKKAARTKPASGKRVVKKTESPCQFSLAIKGLSRPDFLRLWQSLGTKPKLGLGYSVTASVENAVSATKRA